MDGLAGEQREERRTDRVDVRRRVDLPALAEHLLGRHVRGRPEEQARRRRLVLLRGLLDVRDPEVEHLHGAVREHEDVLRLDVAMDDALLVRDREDVEDLLADVDDLGDGEPPAEPLATVLEDLALSSSSITMYAEPSLVTSSSRTLTTPGWSTLFAT